LGSLGLLCYSFLKSIDNDIEVGWAWLF